MTRPTSDGFGRPFWLLTLSNGFFFAGFHGLLPTVPLRALALGGSTTEVGLVAGIFVLASLLVRFFADALLRTLGTRTCLVIGILIAGFSAALYSAAPSITALFGVRLVSGAGFGIGTTFYVTAIMEFIPAGRRGEGLGYFGLATTLAMACAPASALWIAGRWGFAPMFLAAAACEVIALATLCVCPLPARAATATQTGATQTGAGQTGAVRARGLLARLVEPGTRRAVVMVILFGTAYGGILNFVAVYARTLGLGLAGVYFLVGTGCIVLARLATRTVYDRFGVAWAVAPGGVVLAVGGTVLACASGPVSFLASAALYGWGVGMLFPALQTETLAAVGPSRRAAASAAFSNALDIGLGGGSVVLGFLAQYVGLSGAYLVGAAALVIMLGVLALVPRPAIPVGEAALPAAATPKPARKVVNG